MDLEINPHSATPMYQQIRDRIVEGIATGALRRNDSLPSVRALAGSFGINANTVVKAYDTLRAEGFIAANAKSGTFVARDVYSGSEAMAAHGEPSHFVLGEWRARLFTLLAEARAQGASAEDLRDVVDLTLSALVPPSPQRPDAAASKAPGEVSAS